MATTKIAFVDGGPKRVVIKTGLFYRGAKVFLDGTQLGEIKDKDALTSGAQFVLSDGSELLVRLQPSGLDKGIQAHHQKRLLPGSAGTPQQRVHTASGIATFIACSSIIVGLLGFFGVLDGAFAAAGFGLSSVFVGGIFAVCAWYMRDSQALWATVVAAAVWCFDVIATFAWGLSSGGNPASGIVLRAIFLFFLVRAVPAAWELHQSRKASKQNDQMQHAQAAYAAQRDAMTSQQ